MNVGGLAFVLYKRAYLNSSAIVSFFSQQQGRIDAVARAAAFKKNQSRFDLLPFVPLTINAKGKGGLLNLSLAQSSQAAYNLQGRNLYCALYLNELLYLLLPKFESNPTLFKLYQLSIESLSMAANSAQQERLLRNFELRLLSEIGYGINFAQDVSGNALQANSFYTYQQANGFVKAKSTTGSYSGSCLLQIGKLDYPNSQVRQAAKKLLREAINNQLGHRKLKSRELFLPA